MDTRFAHLYKRDSSVSLIRLKLSRRRSQSQKENREKMQNQRRHLDQLPEIELSMDASSIMLAQGDAPKTKDVNAAAEERKKMLARYKENKMLQKEKEKREKEKKGVFKVGLYKPQPLGYLPANSAGPARGKATEPNQSTRVTRSMMQKQKPAVQRQASPKKVEKAPPSKAPSKNNSKPLTSSKGRIATVEPSVRAPNTRSAAKANLAKPVTESRVSKTKSTIKCPAVPSTVEEKAKQDNTKPHAENKLGNEPAEKKDTTVDSVHVKEEEVPQATPSSFAPQGFVFQPPDGLTSFQPEPLSPRSASAFLSPSFVFGPNMEPTFPSPPKPLLPAPPVFSPPPSLSTDPTDLSDPNPVFSPPPIPSSSEPSTSAAEAASPSVPLDPLHDVAYFRGVMSSETERLTGLSEQWESRFDDTSIPEETRDLMRTAVGQARLLMKERFRQFSRLVDDCDLGRGEKITTCTDLQGFWDMVYFQVEDVNRKFKSLTEAEARDWKEEVRPVARKRVAKKPPVAGGKAAAGGGASAAAKSRLAAVKAAMRAKQAEQKAPETKDDNNQTASSSAPVASANTLPLQTVVFHGGFFQVESPVKPSALIRRSTRISAVPSPQCSKFTTPSRKSRANPASHASQLPCSPSRNHSDILPVSTPLHSSEPLPQSPKPPQFSPEHHQTIHVSPETESSSHNQPQFDLSPKTCNSRMQPDIGSTQESRLANQSHDTANQSETELPTDSSEPCPELTACNAETMVCSPSFEKNTEQNLISEEIKERAEACSGSEEVDADPSVCGLVSTTLTPSTPTKDCDLTTAVNDNVVISACDSSPSSTDVEMTGNSEADAGLDIERYLQQSVRYSMSPVQRLTEERFSLGVVDAEMESPVSQLEEHTPDVLETPTALPRMLFTPRTDQMLDNLLLFTPEKRERVRQSVCEHDLITFTPPPNK